VNQKDGTENAAYPSYPYLIVGDSIYGGNRTKNLSDSIAELVESMRRTFLHSSRIEFTHPHTGERMKFHTPLPPELQALLFAIEKRRENT